MLRGAPVPNKRIDRSGSGQANASECRALLLWPPLPGLLAVKHRRQPMGNPDVSLYLGVRDSGASARHARGVHCGCAGSDFRLLEHRSDGRRPSSRHRSKSGRDRNSDTRPPAHGSAHIRKSGLSPASQNSVNAEAISTEPAERAILIAHPCSVHAWGLTSVWTWRFEPVSGRFFGGKLLFYALRIAASPNKSSTHRCPGRVFTRPPGSLRRADIISLIRRNRHPDKS
jgi:hypothetical protein